MRAGQPGHRFRHRVTDAARKRDLGQIEPEPDEYFAVTFDGRLQLHPLLVFRSRQHFFFGPPFIDTFDPGAPQFHQTAQPLAAQHVVQIGDQIETAQIAPQSQQAGHSLVPPFQIGREKLDVSDFPEKRLQISESKR